MQVHYPCLATAVVLVLAMIVLMASVAPPWWVLAIVAIPAMLLGIVGLRLQLVADNYERDQSTVENELRPATSRDLAWILEKGERFPEIAHQVQQWIAQGCSIRQRDVQAIRAYLFHAEPQVERKELLAKLAGTRS